MKRRGLQQRKEAKDFVAKEQNSLRKNRSSRITKLRMVLALLAFALILLGCNKEAVDNLTWFNRGESMVSQRFPKYGTREFVQKCNWTVPYKQNKADCTFLLRPFPGGNEGIGEWISQAASGYISAMQTGCRFLMDYGDSVDIHQVLTPLSTNWTIPVGFKCSRSNRCANVSITHKTNDHKLRSIGKRLGRRAVRVPNYRHAYLDEPYLHPNMLPDLFRELPGFILETGMACSLGHLFDLAPTASQFQPDLFTRMLPTLRDEKTLVIAIYFRSGYTDIAAHAEKEGTHVQESTARYKKKALPCLKCALALEEKYLAKGRGEGLSISRVVWMVVTDSSHVKQWIHKSYFSQDVNHKVLPMTDAKAIPREIVTTTSRGVHTRSARNPSTADFAEAMIDWYLIGESDVVVTSFRFYSFGATASLRTARPLYEATNCTELPRFDPSSSDRHP